ncbi:MULTISPECIES: transposase [Flavobacterium]|uniref:Transposase n=1 Tax=Flavobacterium jumunjinense TaxID=998845 RepID=A0ABV5GQE8_9FLAO|nr:MULTISPECIES: transposase [Flavobacterium]
MEDNVNYNNETKGNRKKLPQRKSIRLKGYDYSQAGLYFITICCEDRICRFGHIEKGIMILNAYGQIAHDAWLQTAAIRKNVTLYEFIIMPNHIHGIIVLNGRGELHSPDNNNNNNIHECNSSSNGVLGECNSSSNGVLGECNSPLRSPSQTLGAIVRGYKSSVTKQMGLMGFNEKLWQRNYYDHIIRNEQSYQNIANYILNNPAKWGEDKFYEK